MTALRCLCACRFKRVTQNEAEVPATVSGMLGGMEFVSEDDLAESRQLLLSLAAGGRPGLRLGRALDCGAGIGRISKLLLCPLFSEGVDLQEQSDRFRAKAREYVGSDKLLPYLKRDPEPNPAMGWRAVRISLDQEALFRMQLRALLAAAEGRELRVMFPMIADVAEFEAARAVLMREVEWARARGRAGPAILKVGAQSDQVCRLPFGHFPAVE